jgi:Predicted 6-phosphogluconate dehydrogenase
MQRRSRERHRRAASSTRVAARRLDDGATEENIQLLVNQLASGDIVVDGGNAHYHDSQRRGRLLAEKASVSLMPACPAASGVSGKATA